MITTIEAIDIPDAWFQCVSKVLEVGFKYEIQQGSYVGQTRMEFDWINILIKNPYAEPYDKMLPQIPVHLNIPNPVADGYVEQYLPYLMTSEIDKKEQYTYGSRIVGDHIISKGQVSHYINLLKETPNTNQAVLQVAQPSDCLLSDPPCLRHIDMRVKEEVLGHIADFVTVGVKTVKKKKLWFYPYFRSWDLWGGFPANLAGIAVLQKYMADEIGVEVGPMIASSKGLHLYGYVEEFAKLRTNK